MRTMRGGERGSVTLEIAVLAPALLLVVFTIVQVGLWSYARSLALAAAQEGVAVGRAHGARPGAGGARAEQFLTRAAGDSLVGPAVRVERSAASLRIEVTGRALSVLPGVPGLPVRQHAEGPLERFTAP